MNNTELLEYIENLEAIMFDLIDHIAFVAGWAVVLGGVSVVCIFFIAWFADKSRHEVKVLKERVKSLEEIINPTKIKMTMNQKQFNDVNPLDEEGG